MATPTSGSGGSAGLQTAYAATTSPIAAASLASITVPGASWYDVEIHAWNDGTTGVVAVDDLNIGLYADPATAGTPVFQRVIPWSPFKDAAGVNPFAVRTRVYALSTIGVNAIAAGTTGAIYVVAVAVTPVEPGSPAV